MMNSLLRHLPVLLGLACGAVLAQSQDGKPEQSPLRINGFGTLGATSTYAPSGWHFRRDAAQYPVAGSTAFDTDARLGLQVHYELNSQTELASQLLIKRRLPGSKPIESVEWLFAAYKPSGDVTVRVGRTSPDLFLLSDYRNVGVAYPWVRPNVEVYSGLPLYTVDGADVSYVWDQGDARWRAKVFAGAADARATLAYSPDQVIFKLRSAGGLILTREADGLMTRATLGAARMTAASPASAYQAQATLRSLESYPDPTIAQQARDLERSWGLDTDTAVFAELGVSYDRDDWIWSAEYTQVLVNTGTRQAHSGYVSLGRRFGDVTLFGMLGREMSTRGALQAPDWRSLGASAQTLADSLVYGINASRTRQTSLSLGARWDVLPQAALKLQWDHFWVSAVGSGLWAGRGSQQEAQPHVLSATLDFTF